MKTVNNLRYKRTLFVGLGGAGAKTLRLLKEQIKGANGGKLPVQVKFLLIDTNATDLANYRDFDCSEKVCIAVREPYQRYKHDKDVNVPTHKFIPKQNIHSLLALERGAGQIRSNGHFAVIENQYSNKLAQVFRHAAEELEDIDVKGETLERDPKIEVRLVFSLAGGTGSGTFLPISLLLRSAIKHCELTAYMYSATHYERIVEKSAKYCVMQNAYASLCELDYMMHFGLNNRFQEPIQFNFGPEENQWIIQSSRPFEEVYYIDKVTSLPTSDTIEFAYNEIDRMQKNTADALFLAATNIISSHTGTIDNVRQKVMEGQFDVNDKFAWVSGLGMAELYLCPQGITAPKVVAAGNVALLARTGECEISNNTKNSIVSSFMDAKWDESKGDDDGDPILSNFLTNEEITRTCRDILVAIRRDNEPYHMSGVNLDRVLQENAKPQSVNIISSLTSSFANSLDDLIMKLLNKDEYGIQHITGSQGKDYGISLVTLKTILEGIRDKLTLSIKKLGEEQKEHYQKETEASGQVDAFLRANTINNQAQNTPNLWNRLFGGQQQDDTPTQHMTVDLAVQLATEKSKPLSFKVLAERDGKAIEVLNSCLKCTEDIIKSVELWHTILKAAYDYGLKQQRVVDNPDPHSEKKENRVDVQLLDVDRFRLSYEDIKNIAENRNKNSVDEGQSVFEKVCMMISAKTGDLQHYLSEGVNKRKAIDDDKRSQYNKEQRTPFQKSIDRLIDLSTPTLQIDGHGFGERVKADQFWYVMTDCGEDEIVESRDQRKSLKSDSVGGLLKTAIEQNTLDERVNLVHVSGWKNKALLYRVLAAVPPYFVEGVCSSDCGGITLESCYEELKKTKRTYTPFSHETLQKKLENGRSVLKPLEATTDDVALEHWVNLMILHKIDVKHEKTRSGKERVNMRGVYTIASESLGEFYTGEVVEPTKILKLGDGARVESFNMFARYCNALIDENEDYKELINPLQNEGYKETFILTPENYMDNILVGFYGFDKKAIENLPEDDPDKALIRKEMSLFRQRKQKFDEEEVLRQQRQDIFDSHNLKDKE